MTRDLLAEVSEHLSHRKEVLFGRDHATSKPETLSTSLYRKENEPVESSDKADIANRKYEALLQAQASLQESEERFRIMADTAPVMIWLSGQNKLCTFFNTPWLTFTGRLLEEEIGSGWTQGVHAQDFEHCLTTYEAAFDKRKSFRMEYRLKRHDGQYRWILDTGTPRYNSNGTFAGYIGSCIDVTEQKELEEKLRQSNEVLEERVKKRTLELESLNRELQKARDRALDASNMKSAFVATISHELRTPLSIIIGITELLSLEKLSSKQDDMAEKIQESAQALLVIVNDLLDMAKIEANKLKLESIPFNAIFLAQECTKLFAASAQSKGLKLTAEFDEQIPELVLGDPTRLRQILINLIGNAIKFTEHGEIVVKAQVEYNLGSSVTLRFEVEDTGIGIADEQKRHIFSSFSQADSSHTRKYGGTGLGLAISKQLAELMSGEMGFESTDNSGSTFWFRIKLRRVVTDSNQHNAKNSLTSTARPDRQILIVEDNDVMREVVKMQIARIGFSSQVVSNGADALQAVKTGSFDLILMDCNLPDMSGFETTKLIREWEKERHHHTPIIALTALAMSGDSARCLNAGMDDYMSKPFKLQQLQDKVNLWLALRQE